MANKDSKKLKESIAQYNKAIIAVFALFAFFLIFNFLYSAEISNLSHEDSLATCPEEVYPSFNLIFENTGQMETELCVEVTSDTVNFEEDKKCLQTPSKETTEFVFSILNDPKDMGIDNFEIRYTWDYRKNLIQPKSYSTLCRYSINGNEMSVVNN